MVSKPILEECVVFALPRDLAPQFFSARQLQEMQAADAVSLKMFAQCPFIRLSSYTWLGKHFDRCCEEEQTTPRVVLDSGSVLTVLNCCMEGIGAALIPSLYLKKLTAEQRNKLYLFRWDYPEARCSSAVLYLKSSYVSAAARDFVRVAQTTCAALKDELDSYLD